MAESGDSGIKQMAMLMMNPQFAAQQQKFALQQAMAQKMMEEGAQQPPTAQLANPGGMVVRNSPVAALARALQQGMGGYMAGKAIDNFTNGLQDMADQRKPDLTKFAPADAMNAATDIADKNIGMGPATKSDVNAQLGNMLMGGNAAGGSDDQSRIDMMLGAEKYATAEYEQAHKLGNIQAQAAEDNKYRLVPDQSGKMVPASTLQSLPPQQQPQQGWNIPNTRGVPVSAPVPQPAPVAPPQPGANHVVSNPVITPQGKADLSDMYPDPAATTGNVMPNPVAPPAANSNSAEGAANVAGQKSRSEAVGKSDPEITMTATDVSTKAKQLRTNIDAAIQEGESLQKRYPVGSQNIDSPLGGLNMRAEIGRHVSGAPTDVNDSLTKLESLSGDNLLEVIRPFVQGTGQVRAFEGVNFDKLTKWDPNEPVSANIVKFKQLRSMVDNMESGAYAKLDSLRSGQPIKSPNAMAPSQSVTHVWTPSGIKPIGGQ